jgi:hypothetical protein
MQLNQKAKENSDLQTKLDQASRQPRTEPIASAGGHSLAEPHQCWVENHFESPNPHQTESKSATTVMFHCNYKIDAPFSVAVKFDRDCLYGGVTIPGAGVVMGGGGSKMPGNIWYGVVDAPNVPANHLVLLTVQAPSDQFPRALSGEIKSK